MRKPPSDEGQPGHCGLAVAIKARVGLEKLILARGDCMTVAQESHWFESPRRLKGLIEKLHFTNSSDFY